jgi:nucleoside-diphosphate-sugar epimerase
MENPLDLAHAADRADAVIHTAFNHDFSRFQESCELDRRVIETFGDAIKGSNRRLLVTSGLASRVQGRPVTEFDPAPSPSPEYPRASEATALVLADGGVNAATIRLPQVHDPVKQGLVSYLVRIAREKGVSAYVGDGSNCWSAVHVRDAARLYRLALEQQRPGARYHAVAEECVQLKDIACAIGTRLNVPAQSLSSDQAGQHFGFFARFVGMSLCGSSQNTRKWLNWQPAGPGLLAALEHFQLAPAQT